MLQQKDGKIHLSQYLHIIVEINTLWRHMDIKVSSFSFQEIHHYMLLSRVLTHFTSMWSVHLVSQNLLQSGAIDFGESLTLKRAMDVYLTLFHVTSFLLYFKVTVIYGGFISWEHWGILNGSWGSDLGDGIGVMDTHRLEERGSLGLGGVGTQVNAAQHSQRAAWLTVRGKEHLCLIMRAITWFWKSN